MRVSYNWLKELVEINISPEEMAEKLTNAGIEVESLERLQSVEGVVIGLITEIRAHEAADKLLVCRVDTGGSLWTIVTGAKNVQEGQKVPVALPGARLAGGKIITVAKIRGVESSGMLCSAEELGLDVDKLPAEQKDGIYILPADTPLGKDIVEVLGLDDVILELCLTPNRSDCLGMINVAREVAALTGGQLRLPQVEASAEGGPVAQLTSVEIRDPQLCRRFVARVIQNVKIEPSPLWLQQRLIRVGIRPINNIVDVTNYIMMETGQPLHAYDYDALSENRIVVRRAQAGEELVTLDGQKRQLKSEMLVIADAEKAAGLAGVMGGLATEVTEQTKNILLEAAHFDPVTIRRTALALGMRSEASLRFEKGVDVEQTAIVADRTVQLLEELGAGTAVPGHVDCYPGKAARAPINVKLQRINQLLGTELTAAEVEKIFQALQFTIEEKNADGWLIMTPSYRTDLGIEADIIEEVARLNGYDKIPTTLPQGDTTQGKRTWAQQVQHRLGQIMTSQGLFEVITYSFHNPRHLDLLNLPADHKLRDAVVIKNPLSEEQGMMRTTLLPGLLDVVARNLNKRNKNLRFYELGKIYSKGAYPQAALPDEKTVLGMVATGRKEKEWLYGEEEYGFFYLKGVVENILKSLGIPAYTFKQVQTVPWLHPGRTASIFIDEEELGIIGEIHPLVLEKYDISQRVTFSQLDVELLIAKAQERPVYQPIPRYPAVSRDLAIVVPDKVENASIEKVITRVGQGLLRQIRLFDLYRGQQVTEGYKSMAYSLTWQAEDRTLTDEEVNALHQQIEEALSQELGADLRR